MSGEHDPHAYLPWIRPDLQPGERGACAVVIGVSRYRHLPRGDGRSASRSYGLGQLSVSALTAYRFFRWLRDSYRYQGQRLSHCWLLLAPTAAEVAVEPLLAPWLGGPDGSEGRAAPTFHNCEAAILAWARELSQRRGGQHGRAFFFFSGHGLEASLESQILLPCDYLSDDRPNRAISVRNLKAGLAALSVRDQFFFIDACRNDHVDLRSTITTGFQILEEPAYPRRIAQRTAPVFYASAWGGQAWQPSNPASVDDLTFYGQALLEGLQLKGAITPSCEGQVCAIDIFTLQNFLQQRLPALLPQGRPEIGQRAVLGGNITNLIITEVDPPPPSQRIDTTAQQPRSGPTPHNVNGRALDQLDDQALLALFDEARIVDIWRRARLYQQSADAWLEPGRGIRLWRLARPEQRSYEVELSIADGLGTCMLQLGDMLCWLPDYDGETPRYLLDLAINRSDAGGYAIGWLTAGLARSNARPLGDLAGSEMAEAAQNPGRLSGVLAAPAVSRLARALAAGLLLRLDSADLITPERLDALARGPRAIPEGPLLSWRRSQAVDSLRKPDREEENRSLSRAARLGLPMLSQAFEVLLEIAHRRAGPDYGHTVQDELLARVRGVAAHLRPGGLFTVFQAGPSLSAAERESFPERWLPLAIHKPDALTLHSFFPEGDSAGERTKAIFQT